MSEENGKANVAQRGEFEPQGLYSQLEALVGGTILGVARMDAEIKRAMGEYAVILVQNGQGTFRVLLQFSEVMKPVPPFGGDAMWQLMSDGFLTQEEVRACHERRPFILPEWENNGHSGE